MSASGYTSCPRCVANGPKKPVYGEGTEEEYNQAKREYEIEMTNESLRLDYEVITKEGKVRLVYYAMCSTCKFKFKVEQEWRMIP